MAVASSTDLHQQHAPFTSSTTVFGIIALPVSVHGLSGPLVKLEFLPVGVFCEENVLDSS